MVTSYAASAVWASCSNRHLTLLCFAVVASSRFLVCAAQRVAMFATFSQCMVCVSFSGLERLVPGGDICPTAGTLWLSGLAPGVSEAALFSECAQYGAVQRVALQPGSAGGEAFVAYADVSCARSLIECYVTHLLQGFFCRP